jgi:DMSO/TMAO reductase YedYZ heme-binding membrane subunit
LQNTITRYSSVNIILLVAGALVCLFTNFLLIMTAGFGADPVHDYRSFAIVCLLCVGLLSAPSYLLTLRWSRIGSIAMWSVALSCSFIALAGGVILHFLGLVVLLLVEGLICGAINSGSQDKAAPASEQNKA